MSSQGKKRGGRGSSSNSSKQQHEQQQSQVRHGSSFCTCPACGTAVHSALMAFHISSCPVVSAAEVPVKRVNRRLLQSPEEKGERGSPEFSVVSASNKKRVVFDQNSEDEEGVSKEQGGRTPSPRYSVEAGDWGETLFPDPETPSHEGGDKIAVDVQMTELSPVGGTRRDSDEGKKMLMDGWGQLLSPEPELVEPLSPNDNAPASWENPQVKRAKTTKDHGAATLDKERTVVVDLGLLHPGSESHDVDLESHLCRVRDSQEEGHDKEEAVAVQQALGGIEKIVQEQLGNSKKLESRMLSGDGHRLPGMASDNHGDGKRVQNGVSQREVELERDLLELKGKYSGALRRESALRRALEVKSEECEDVRRREQGVRSELLSVRGQLKNALQGFREQRAPNEIQKPSRNQSSAKVDEDDVSMATQLLSETSSPPASFSSRPRGAQDELVTTRGDSENHTMANNLSLTDDENEATQLLSQASDLAYSLGLSDSVQNAQPSARPQNLPGEFRIREVSSSFAEPADEPLAGSTLSPSGTLGRVDNRRVRRLFDRVAEMTGGAGQSSKDEPSVKPLQTSEQAVAVLGLAPQTPGKALQQPTHEPEKNEVREGIEGESNVTSYTVGHQRIVGTPGGPETPEKFSLILGGREKGLISELLDRFPPAQGTETQCGIDPFDDKCLEAANKNATMHAANCLDKSLKWPGDAFNLHAHPKLNAHIPKDPTPLRYVRSLVRDDGKGRDAQRVETSASPSECIPEVRQSSEDSEEETLAQIRVKKKRRKTALVVDSDSDVDKGDSDVEIVHEVRPPLRTDREDLREGTGDGAKSGLKISKSNSGMGGSTFTTTAEKEVNSTPLVEGFTRVRLCDKRMLSIPSANDLMHTEEEGTVLEGAEVSSRTGIGRSSRSSSGHIPDLIMGALNRERSRDKQVLSPPPVSVVLSSEGEEDICGGSLGSGRKGKRRKLVIQEYPSSDDGEGVQPDPEVEELSKDTGKKVLRRSERLRGASASPQTIILSDDDQGKSDAEGNKGLGRTGRFKAHVVENDEEIQEIGSDSSDGKPIGVPQRRTRNAAESKRNSEFQRDPYGNKLDMEVDDDEDDDSSFINDDPESGAEGGDESSNSGAESESDGSSSSRASSDDHKKKFDWEFEGDMLAALAKDTGLCLRGLCALYRRQEEDEQRESLSKYRNKRGFDKFHSVKASNIASFLLGGPDSSGAVLKTAAQLQDHFGENAVTYCSDMCIHHSKQLFEIYENDEDPYFPNT